ncbi:MAG: primosomal protein N' [Methylovulum sp.]|uniref:primosomal protein N' n=1 Tax=Methylovulum sp. TaxID=1916980 RepID=UPI002632F833|nr:primosomal protein N' [Methylovulum sp.]MDD2724941.1 primosomal protein N' [Methylovulum sp.]MDD5123535.1 primosomal protein N' [Methylovulum sp.]
MPASLNAPTRIFRVALPVPVFSLFDYLAVDNVSTCPGIRIEVPFGKANKIGVLIEIADESTVAVEKLKPIVRLVDDPPLLSATDLALLQWVSRYYHHPLGMVVSSAFPAGLRQGKAAVLPTKKYYALTESGKQANSSELKRAPRQQSLLELFQQQATALSETELSLWHSQWRITIKGLIQRQWLELATVATRTSLATAYGKPVGLLCNPDQQAAITAVGGQLGKFGVFLLDGVTGSGKTEVYMQLIAEVLAQGLQVLVLVPEITLTPQLADRFRQRFTIPIALSHSGLTDTQRQTAWLQVQQGEAAILLGTRSALFTPFKQLGLIILDEEHDASFKQQEGFRFSARDVAVMRGKLLDIPVLLGSATPSMESLYNVTQKRYQRLALPNRAGSAIPPVLQLLDIRNKRVTEGLSDALLTEIKTTLAKSEQALLFLNRRGFAPTLICHSCGWVARCQRCDANLVMHQREQRLRCHHCASEQALPRQCPACKTGELTALGLGTERIEQVLNAHFPDKTVIRLDRDSTQRKGSLEEYLEQIHAGHADIILGTQMLAKGHHFANVTLVAIIDVDSGLFSIDFHATEKLAQLVVQVSGRAGRADKPGKVIMQTRRPEHPLLTTLINEGYHRFAQTVLDERKTALLPPFSYQVLLRAYAIDENAPANFLNAVVDLLKNKTIPHTQILGPVSAPMAKRGGRYHYQLLLQSTRRQELHVLLDELMPQLEKLKTKQKVRWSLDVDPVDLY